MCASRVGGELRKDIYFHEGSLNRIRLEVSGLQIKNLLNRLVRDK